MCKSLKNVSLNDVSAHCTIHKLQINKHQLKKTMQWHMAVDADQPTLIP